MRTRYFQVVKLEGDRDLDACAGRTMADAIEALGPLSETESLRRVLSQRVRATDEGAARLMTSGPWIWTMHAKAWREHFAIGGGA